MTNEQQQVKEWMQKAGQQCPDRPTVPSLEVRRLRARLILEEALETIRYGLGLTVAATINDDGARVIGEIEDLAFVPYDHIKPNLTELADGCADLAVVTIGTLVACGIDGEPVFAEVCRSNNSKWWKSSELDSEHFEPKWNFEPLGHGLFCVTDEGGKVRKSPSYSPADIQPIIEAQR